jgi:hypothetical protein
VWCAFGLLIAFALGAGALAYLGAITIGLQWLVPRRDRRD